MSIARDDTGNIRELHTKASGLSSNFRDASGGTGGTRLCVNFIELPFYLYMYIQPDAFRQMEERAHANPPRKSTSVPTPSLGQGLNRAIDRGRCRELVRIRSAVE
jgi:hypothetical protein